MLVDTPNLGARVRDALGFIVGACHRRGALKALRSRDQTSATLVRLIHVARLTHVATIFDVVVLQILVVVVLELRRILLSTR